MATLTERIAQREPRIYCQRCQRTECVCHRKHDCPEWVKRAQARTLTPKDMTERAY